MRLVKYKLPYYEYAITLSQLADILGTTRENAYDIERKARIKFKAAMLKRGIDVVNLLGD